MSKLEATCPYCGEKVSVLHRKDYEPVYHHCEECGEKFVLEPLASRVACYRMGEAPGWSDPEARAIDAAGHDEQ